MLRNTTGISIIIRPTIRTLVKTYKHHPRFIPIIRNRPILVNHRKNRGDATLTSPFYGAPRPRIQDSVNVNGSVNPSLQPLDRVSLAISSAFTALSDPNRADAVAALGELSGTVSLRQMYDRMMLDPEGQRILQEKPIVTNMNIGDLDGFIAKHGKGSFGEAYGEFMKIHGFDPDGRSDVKYIADAELSYVMLRYRQNHDFWHTLFGLPPTVLGEIALKWVELLQTGLPVAGLSAAFGPMRLNAKEREVLHTKYIPWALEMGKNTPFLMNIYYEELFSENLQSLRKKLKIESAPAID